LIPVAFSDPMDILSLGRLIDPRKETPEKGDFAEQEMKIYGSLLRFE
jgi:hypothetical protein